MNLKLRHVLLILGMCIAYLVLAQLATGEMVHKEITSVEMSMEIEDVTIVLTSVLGKPIKLGEVLMWSFSTQRIYALRIPDGGTSLFFQTLEIKKREAPKIKKVASVWTRPIGTWRK